MLIELVGVMKEIKYLKDSKIRYYAAKKYIQYRLKRDFFDKFHLGIYILYSMIQELLVLDSDFDHNKQYISDMINEIPMVKRVLPLMSYGSIEFAFKYYNYDLAVCASSKEGERWHIHISTYDSDENYITISLHPTLKRLNLDNTLRPIILMSIYNYCVVYVYGEECLDKYNKLLMKDKIYLLKIRDMFREAGYLL